ncbi:MAG: hypothetical protein A3F78_12215 [Burkholderiales bacterium RIFCSPLOWO2_12_FULL_61_40]|nr:MAG: hypothetical protein A3F78_12215 [Burkholderiales bacterium RIFCSPLOWO2_12_FULL_61_40]
MAYIVVGILVGPAVLGLADAPEQINLLAQVGITVLLFVVGLKLDLRHIRQIGPVALTTGLGQLGFTIVFGFFLILALGKAVLIAQDLAAVIAMMVMSFILPRVMDTLAESQELLLIYPIG